MWICTAKSSSACSSLWYRASWGEYDDGRSFIQDTETGVTYVIRDKSTPQSILYTIELGDANITPLGEIDTSIVANSLFIK